jgi:lipid-binding SYLF domain-containing protein
MISTRRAFLSLAALGSGAAALRPHRANAASARDISHRADQALRRLYAESTKARELGARAVAILVFPRIYKGGFIVGGQSGNGALRVHGRTTAYYNISAASFGLQAGGQAFSYVLFFMNQGALDYLSKSDGWAIGSGPSVVVVDKGTAATLTSTTLSQDVYAFPFGQKGLMAGLGLEGSKITRFNPGP